MHVVAGTGATEYLPAVQLVHTLSAVAVQPAAFLLVPAGHAEHAAHGWKPEEDHVLPATHGVFDTHASAVGLQT